MVLPDAEATRLQFPETVRLTKLMDGTAVIAADWLLLMITSSPAAGTPLLQLPAVVHKPPVVGVHVVVLAKAAFAKSKFEMISAMTNDFVLSKNLFM